MSRLLRILVLAAVVGGACAGTASALVIRSTPLKAAMAQNRIRAAQEVKAINHPGVYYTLGSCRPGHRTPWVAYVCDFYIHREPLYCHGVLTVAIKQLGPGRYRARQINAPYVDSHECP
jgi:hypothetical protein